jgi:(E)-4-hydroxy-3-methylbut-2-enyl-diphosphate synthase
MFKTRKIKIGSVTIGGGLPVAVQSMTKTDTHNIKATVGQIRRLENVGCEIVRVAVPDISAAKVLKRIKKEIKIPLVADIHFDYRLALESIDQGVDKIRINPGNIGSESKVKEIVKRAKQAKIPIRIGINAGSMKKRLKVKGGNSITGQMADTAMEYIKMFEDWDFSDIVVSVKAADVPATIEAYRLLAKKIDYPLHLGITESGPPGIGTVKSAIGIGLLLSEGIGDTIRVSLTAPPEQEVKVAYQILQASGIRKGGIEIISCPTCSRCKVNLIKLVNEFENKLCSTTYPHHIKVAIMGCEVNGPGEAKHADIGIAGGKSAGLLFKGGKPIKKVKPEQWVTTLIKEIQKINSVKNHRI